MVQLFCLNCRHKPSFLKLTVRSNSLAKRILVLAQKGDWAACESALKALERSAGEEGAAKPLADIADNVSLKYNSPFINLCSSEPECC